MRAAINVRHFYGEALEFFVFNKDPTLGVQGSKGQLVCEDTKRNGGVSLFWRIIYLVGLAHRRLVPSLNAMTFC